jgi:hypothetical protein
MRRHSIVRPRGRALLLGAGLALLAAGAWILATSTAAPNPAAAPQPEPPAGTAAMRVAIQPETGDLVPAAAGPELDALGFPKPSGDLVVRQLPDGALRADISGHFMSYSVAHRSADGSIDQTCVSDPQAARELLQAPTAPPSPSNGEDK